MASLREYRRMAATFFAAALSSTDFENRERDGAIKAMERLRRTRTTINSMNENPLPFTSRYPSNSPRLDSHPHLPRHGRPRKKEYHSHHVLQDICKHRHSSRDRWESLWEGRVHSRSRLPRVFPGGPSTPLPLE